MVGSLVARETERGLLCEHQYRTLGGSPMLTGDKVLQNMNSIKLNKKLCYRKRNARRTMSVIILSPVETICTTNSQQIEVLEGYSRPTCS